MLAARISLFVSICTSTLELVSFKLYAGGIARLGKVSPAGGRQIGFSDPFFSSLLDHLMGFPKADGSSFDLSPANYAFECTYVSTSS